MSYDLFHVRNIDSLDWRSANYSSNAVSLELLDDHERFIQLQAVQ